MKKYITKQSSIKGAGKGLFTKDFFKKGEVIGLAHVNDQPASEIGRNHNHNEENPTAYSKKINNKRFIYASKNLKPGEEITTNYRMQPELEQPEDFMRKGGSVLRLPNKKNSKGYSRSLSATNKLFTQNFLFAKPKSKKNKVFDPNSKYYAEGGSLLTKKVTCKKCGWKWDAEDGGKDITTCHKCGGQGLVHAQGGGVRKFIETYKYLGRPDSLYKKSFNGKWLISNKSTGNEFVSIEDPKGFRTKELDKNAVTVSSLNKKRIDHLIKLHKEINFPKEFVDLKDTRTVRATTGEKINPNVDLKADKYNKVVIDNIIKKAKAVGVDPSTMLAIALQETNFGKKDSNLGHALYGDIAYPYGYIDFYKEKLNEAKRAKIDNELLQIQYYNGLGTVYPETEEDYHGFKMQKIYGVPLPASGINMRKNPLYGKQIIDLRDNVILKNPYIQKALKQKQKGGDKGCPNGQVWSKKDKKCIDLPVFGNSLNSETFTKSTNLSDGFKIKPLNSFSDFGKIKPKKIPVVKDSFLETLEKDINDFLDNPLKKAAQVSESLKEKGEDPSDALRHSIAGSLTAQTIANKTGNIPFISNPLGYLGANIAGIGHELSTLSQAYLDDRPWSVKLQESLEDIYNNSVGTNTIFNNNSEKDKINYLLKLTRTNQLPDGYGEERPFRDNPKWTDPYNQKQYGGNTDAMNGMMKARLAYANEFGNPAAKRMINLPDNPYQFDNGDTGSHYMASMDNYAVPQIQDENGVLQLGDYGPESNEAIRFDSDEDANYFAENYKDVSPGFINEKKEGGASGCPKGFYWNGKKCVKIPKGAKVITDPKEYAERSASYKDSSDLYKSSLGLKRFFPKLPEITKEKYIELTEKDANLPIWNFDKVGYKEDKKLKIKKPLESYVYSYKRSDQVENPTFIKNNKDLANYTDDVFKHQIQLKNGDIKIPEFVYKGKPDFSSGYTIISPNGTSRTYYLNYETNKFNLWDIDSPKIEPIHRSYYGSDKLRNRGSIDFSSTGWYTGKKPNKNELKKWVNNTLDYEYIDTYKKPVQPVVFQEVDKSVVPTTRTVYIECPPGSVSNDEKTDITTFDPDSPGNYLRTITTGCKPEKIENLQLLKPGLIDPTKDELQGNTLNEEVESEYLEEGIPDTENPMEWVNKRKYNIDWNGIQIPYRLPRFRKPGSYGDLIKPGKKRYINLPTIESRNTAYLRPKKQDGGLHKFVEGGNPCSYGYIFVNGECIPDQDCEDGRCEETDQIQNMLDEGSYIPKKNVNMMWDVVDQSSIPELSGGDRKNAKKIWSSKGAQSISERLGMDNAVNCMWAAGMGYQCLPETKGKITLMPFESNDKFINAVNKGTIPFSRITKTHDPNFASKETGILQQGDIINFKGPNISHAMTFSNYDDKNNPIFLDSNGSESDLNWNRGLWKNIIPGKETVAYVSRFNPEKFYEKKIKILEEKARTNPTMIEKQNGGYIEADLNEDEIEEYRKGGYIVEEIDTYQKGGTVYTVKGSKGNYKKVNGKWQVDWNKSGKYQPLSKGDIKARTAVLNKMAKPVDNGISKVSSNSSDNTRVNNIYQKPLSTKNFNLNVNALTGQTIPLSNTKPQVVKPKSVITTNFNINTTDQVKKANAITKEKEIQETILANERLSKNALPKREKTQTEFEADQWKKYNKLDWASKLVDRGKAFGVDPIGMTSRVLTGDQGYIPGMGKGIFSEDENKRSKFLKSINYTPGKFEVSDVQNLLNPFYWGASAGSTIGDGLFNSKDKYGNHKVDLTKIATGTLDAAFGRFAAKNYGKSIKNILQGINYIKNSTQPFRKATVSSFKTPLPLGKKITDATGGKLNLGNSVAAYFGADALYNQGDSNSDVVKSQSNFINNPSWNTLGDASFETGVNSLGFLGLGLGKQVFKPAYNASKNFINKKIINKEIPEWLKQELRFNKLPELNNSNATEVLDAFKKRIKTPEGQKRLKNLGITNTQILDDLKIVEDENTLGYYWMEKIGLNPNLPEFKNVTRHEIEHAVRDATVNSRYDKLNEAIGNFKYLFNPKAKRAAIKAAEKQTTEIDDILSNLELQKTPVKVDWNVIKENRGKAEPSKLYDYFKDKQRATNYFDSGSGGNEKSAFAAEVQQYMMTKGIIPSKSYVKITPEMVKKTFIDAKFDKEAGGKYLRLFNIMKPSETNYKIIAKALNKMLGVTPIIGLGAAATQYKQGGTTNDYVDVDLTPEEIKKYVNGGYVVEEIDNYQNGGVNKKGKSYDYTRDPTYTERFKRFFGMEDVDDIAYEKVDDKNIKKYKQTIEPIKKTIRKIPTIETKSNFELDLKNRLQNIAKENILKEKNISKVEPIKNSLQITKNNNSNIKNKIVKPKDSIIESVYKEIKSFDNWLDNQKKVFDNGMNRKLQTWGIVETKDKKVIESPEPINVKDYYKNPTLSQTILNVNNQPNRQFKQQTVPTSNLVLGSRNRGQYQDIESDGLEFTTFHPFNNAANIKPYNKKTNVNGINDNNSVFALDNKGVLHTGIYKNLKNNKDWKFSRTFMNKIVSIDDISLDGARSGNPKFWQPQITILENNKLKKGALNILTKKGKAEEDYYGSILGGRVVFVNPLTKEQTLVSGSVSHIKKEFKRLKGNSKYLEAWSLDNGTYARGLSYKDGKLTKQRLVNYDAENTSGGNGLYIKKYNVPVNKFKENYVYDMPNVRTKKDDSYKAGHKLKNEIKNFVLHHTAYDNPITNEAEVKKQFMTPGQNSSHVVIEEDGSRTIYASPEQVSFHAGKSKWNGREDVNDFSIGVEFQGDTQKKPLTDQQVISFVEYYAPIAKKYNLNLKSIITHEQIRNAYIKKHANEKGLETKPDITYNQYKRILNYMKAKGIN